MLQHFFMESILGYMLKLQFGSWELTCLTQHQVIIKAFPGLLRTCRGNCREIVRVYDVFYEDWLCFINQEYFSVWNRLHII